MKQVAKEIYLLDSWKLWKTVTVMWWVHGNEKAWIEVIKNLKKNWKVNFWKIYLVLGNWEAIKLNKREYQKNMNRCFYKNNSWNTYEDTRAKEVMKILDESDYLLDIHNTLNKFNSIPFLISEYKEFWEIFPVKYTISWFDEIHSWSSDAYMNSIWKIGLCLESWSIYDKKSYNIALSSVYNFLRYTWNLGWDYQKYKDKRIINFNYIYKNKTMDIKYRKNFKDFEKLKKWELICYDWKEKIFALYDGYLNFIYLPNKIWDEIFCIWREKTNN